MTQSIAERIARLPEMPKGMPHTTGFGTTVVTYTQGDMGQMENALQTRLSVAQDAIDAYLKAVDALGSAGPGNRSVDELLALDDKFNETLADLRLVGDMK